MLDDMIVMGLERHPVLELGHPGVDEGDRPHRQPALTSATMAAAETGGVGE